MRKEGDKKLPKRHGNSKSDTVVEKAEGIDDPFIQRFKIREGWKMIKNYLFDNYEIHFVIDEIHYSVWKDKGLLRLRNIKTNIIKCFVSSEFERVCRVIITADKWKVIS